MFMLFIFFYICRYITGDSTVPLALIGGAGCGKATLVARAVTMVPTPMPDLAIIVRQVFYKPFDD